MLSLFGCSRLLPQPAGSPFGSSVRTPKYIATLIVQEEPRLPSVPARPEKDRFRLGLLLNPLDGAPGRLLPLAKGLRAGDYAHTARLLGLDGPLLWWIAADIGGYDLNAEKLITLADLRRANPSLGDLWETARYEFRGKLRVTAHDYSRAYEIDPATLRAHPVEPKGAPYRPTVEPLDYLTAGGLIAPDEWMGVHTASDVAGYYKVGSRLPAPKDNPVRGKRDVRQIYRGKVTETGTGSRLASISPLSPNEFFAGAWIRGEPGSGPLRLSNPDSFVLAYKKDHSLEAHLIAARVDREGRVLWTADTGIAGLQQILADTASVAFIGTKARIPGKVPEPVVVIVDNRTGAVSSRSLLANRPAI